MPRNTATCWWMCLKVFERSEFSKDGGIFYPKLSGCYVVWRGERATRCLTQALRIGASRQLYKFPSFPRSMPRTTASFLTDLRIWRLSIWTCYQCSLLSMFMFIGLFPHLWYACTRYTQGNKLNWIENQNGLESWKPPSIRFVNTVS
jgi:hypothetical protein